MPYAKITAIVTGINYCVEYQDIADQVAYKHPELDEYADNFDQFVYAEIKRIKEELPQTLTFTVECEPEDLEDILVDAISEETGWLINGFDKYEILEVK